MIENDSDNDLGGHSTSIKHHNHVNLSWGKAMSFDVEIKDLNVNVKVPQWKIPVPFITPMNELNILKDLSNIKVPAGSFCAILGTSGSGKTTLLNTLAGRCEEMDISGQILFNGHAVTPIEAKKSVGYVMQSDHLLPNLTVRETLRYSGMLRLPGTLSKERKLEIVEELIGELALRDCADRLVGGHGKRGISGGEMRRVSIGVQMLSNPGVLFLDEPTSGLDSFTAHNLIQTLLSLSRQNKTIICTIHQPRADIFQLFDYVLLLSKGNVVYFGPTRAIVDHFASLGHECPFDVNPSDFFLDLITINYQTDKLENESKARLGDLITGFQTSPIYQANVTESTQSYQNDTRKFEIEIRNTNYWLQTWLLYHRSMVNMVRDKSVVTARLVETVLIALICGGIFYKLGEDQSGIKSRVSAFYVVVILQPYLIIIANILQYSEELLVYDREYYDGMYMTFPYWLATKAASLPFEVITAFIFSSIFYWMADLRQSAGHFFIFFVFMMLAQYCSASLGFMSASILRSFAASSLMANLLMTFWAITTGFIINPATFPIYMTWVGYTSLYQYSYGGLAANEFKGNSYPCPYPPGTPECSLFNGNDILDRLELKVNNIGVNGAVLVAISTIFNLLSLLALRFITHKPK
ncbi:hypothetical protein PPL_02028 [Heterostelium album PN500]|uniref:ABC transporter domain-containing protein n=1 Tax=Heterostelium pallidum (strain ATCC 26659 / Pp 5 / PN500) TaxID=670386 RepID=D3B158_HETP5|nr:hypothetical protein PPL_02028 [Heterostelium album PN500]EFA85032.1 hypothetical protein PPL_02028 [Heterostelium album PN500]|eukprot:XP_020437142.1 hypothetical protein PPL_02028 [Heterostelium album PN500]